MKSNQMNNLDYLVGIVRRLTITGSRMYDSLLMLYKLSSTMKLYVGATVYCAWYYHMDAIDAIKKANILKREAKMKYGRFKTEMKRYESNLLMSVDGQMRFFHVEDYGDSFEELFGRKVSDREYFEIWQSYGAEMYAECLPLIKSLEHKFHRLFIANHLKDAKARAMSSTADILWDMAKKIFVTECEYCDSVAYMYHARFSDILKALDISSVADRWKEFSHHLVDIRELDIDDATEHDISLGVKTIYEKWTDPLLYQTLQNKSIEAYQDDLFASDEARKKFAKMAEEEIQHIEDCIKEQKMKTFAARQL